MSARACRALVLRSSQGLLRTTAELMQASPLLIADGELPANAGGSYGDAQFTWTASATGDYFIVVADFLGEGPAVAKKRAPTEADLRYSISVVMPSRATVSAGCVMNELAGAIHHVRGARGSAVPVARFAHKSLLADCASVSTCQTMPSCCWPRRVRCWPLWDPPNRAEQRHEGLIMP